MSLDFLQPTRLLLAALVAAVFAVPAQAQPAGDGQEYVPTVLITGANRGIGLEYARQYAERDWNVIATARRPEEATELADYAGKHPRLKIEALDVTDFGAVDALVAKLDGAPVDVLVNNAGITGGARAQIPGRFDYDVYRQVLEVNVIAPLKLVEALLPNLEASRQKKVVNVSSSEGSIGSVDSGRVLFYRSSKAALNMEMRNMAYLLRNKGIAVAMINPGPVDTDMMAGMPKSMLRTREESVEDLIRITDRLTVENTGRLWNYSGELLPW